MSDVNPSYTPAVKIAAALTTIPDRRGWGRCALLYLVFLSVAFPLGLSTGVLRPGLPSTPAIQILATALVAFAHPAFVEELIFRVLLLPRDAASVSRMRLAALVVISLTLYVASHPMNAILFRPQARALFESPAYLTLTTLLGATSTAAYFISRSIWPPVLIHWLTVVVWLFLLGGQALLC
jgi:predicted Abi (CAAX) family protease